MKKFDKLIENVEEFAKSYPLCNAAQKAVGVVQRSGKVMPNNYNDGT